MFGCVAPLCFGLPFCASALKTRWCRKYSKAIPSWQGSGLDAGFRFGQVAARELRVESHQAWNYWSRFIAVCTAAIAIWFAVLGGSAVRTNGRGATVFGALNLAVFIALWIVGPVVTADCLSSERREGTLDLLLLTLLRGPGIVVAKSLAQGIRVLSLVLVVAPLVVFSCVLGGVMWTDVISGLVLNLSGALLALAAGLVASSVTVHRVRAIVLAETLAFLVGACFVIFAAWTQQACSTLPPAAAFAGGPGPMSLVASAAPPTPLESVLEQAFGSSGGPLAVWTQTSTSLAPGTQVHWFRYWALIMAVSLGVFVLSILWVGTRVNRCHPGSEPLDELARRFLSPRPLLKLVRPFQRRRLSLNPVGWPHHYSSAGRLIPWGWFCLVGLFAVAGFSARAGFGGGLALFVVLLLAEAFTVANSYSHERRNGILELLLISPLREEQIVFGRLRSIWGQFFPAIVLIALLDGHSNQFWHSGLGVLAVLTFLMVPVFGLYFSLRCSSFFSAWVSTFTVGIITFLPAAFNSPLAVVTFGVSLFSAPELCFCTLLRLHRRRFSLG